MFIEAGPGTGKTFVLAERFGYLTYGRGSLVETGLTALSFTVSATNVLRSTLVQRWGPQAAAWPNQVLTLDAMFRSLLEFLLRADLICWPGNLKSVEPIDEWASRDRANRRNPVAWVPHLEGDNVRPAKRRVHAVDVVVTARKRLLPQLEAGCCTHDSIRDLVVEAAMREEHRDRLVQFLRAIAGAFIVDEVFDANSTDIELLRLLVETQRPISLVGDPWQALYHFRDAEPEAVRTELLEPHSFASAQLVKSFRYAEGSTVAELSARMRASLPCPPLAAVEEPDVVLAGEWKTLWTAGPEVLPLSFGQVRSQLDAIHALLLDYLLRGCGQPGARLVSAAPRTLQIEERLLADRAAGAFEPIIELLSAGADHDVANALDQLSLVPRDHFGAQRKLAVTGKARNEFEGVLRALGERVRFGGSRVPGLTVHQAKGAEWHRVAVILTGEDESNLLAGLSESNPEHRRLYVALTRGRVESGRYAYPAHKP